MNLDEYYRYLGALITNFAHRDAEDRSNPHWPPGKAGMTKEDIEHIRLVRSIRDLLVRYPVTGISGFGDADGRYIADGPAEHIVKSGIRISPEIVRALAYDAANHGDWWYDPTSPDGLSEYYPGRSLNPDCV